MNFIGFYLSFIVLLIRSLPLLFFSFLKSIALVSDYNYKNRDFLQFITISKFIFINVKDQLNSKNLQIKLCNHLPKFYPQYFLKPSVVYNPGHILGSNKCNLVVRFLMFDSFWNKFVTQMQ